MRLILIGFGTVGQGLAEILRDKAALFDEQYAFAPQIVGVATRTRGILYAPSGLAIPALLEAIQKGHLDHYQTGQNDLVRDWDTLQLIRDAQADVMIEASVSDLQTAQPATDYALAAFESSKHVVLANKGPVALHYGQLAQAAQQAKRQLRYEATVMAGTPVMALAEDALAGCTIQGVRGILNGTTNYILTQMEAGMQYVDALAKAQQLGYAEADPTADVDGWDAAGKVLILANALFGKALQMQDLDVTGIRHLTLTDIQAAAAAGERYKLIASVTATHGRVQPLRLPIHDPLAAVGGATNALTLQTDLLGDVTLIGAGAGRIETGTALLNDVLAIHRQQAQVQMR